MDWTSKSKEKLQADLLEQIKNDIRIGMTNDEISDAITKAGIKGGFVELLIVQARAETRIPDPSDHEAVAAAQPIKFINMRGWDAEPPPEREWAVRDRIPLRQVTLFSGEGGTGKTILTLQLLAATALARDWIGSLPEPGPAIYLGEEDDEQELRRRVHAILLHYDESWEALIENGFHMASFIADDLTLARPDRSGTMVPTMRYDRLLEQACDIQPRIIALDTVADIFGGNENDRVQVSAFMRMLRKLAVAGNSAVMINAHPSNAGVSSGTGLSGSTGWHGKARGRMYLRSAGDENDPQLRMLEFKKNQYGPPSDSIPLRYKNGIYVPEPRGGSIDPYLAQLKADDVFLTLLDRFAREGRNVSSKSGTTFAPAIFAAEPEAKQAKIDKTMLDAAMSRLFYTRKIVVLTEGPPSRQRSRLARATE